MQQQEKQNVKKNKGYLKIHVAVDINTNKEILAFLEVTADEKVHDGQVMLRLIEHILKRNDNRDIKIKSASQVMELTIAMKISNIFKRKGFNRL